MKFRFKDKVVVVTGASSGIGWCTSLAFAKEGASVALVARSEERLQKLTEEIERYRSNHLVVATDVSKKEEVDRMVEAVLSRFGRIDIFVNNAGIGLNSDLLNTKPEDLEKVMDVNFYGPFYCIQAILSHMIERRSGQIINISSVVGKRAVSYMGIYSASKFALNALTDALRVEVAKYGIKVILICPGLTDTLFSHNSISYGFKPDTKMIHKMSPESVARIILKASLRGKREVIISLGGKFLVWMNTFFPRFVDWGMGKWSGNIGGSP